MAHRVGALGVVIAAVWALGRVLRSGESALRGPAWALAAMIPLQAALGASVIWTHRHPEVATGHQSLGALILAASAVLTARAWAAEARAARSTRLEGKGIAGLPASPAVGGAA
jgi:heme A synthase